jgi:hypothetical protein
MGDEMPRMSVTLPLFTAVRLGLQAVPVCRSCVRMQLHQSAIEPALVKRHNLHLATANFKALDCSHCSP